MNKVYQLLSDFELTTNVTVEGKLQYIDFRHGMKEPIFRRGIFMTDDPKLQDAIEKDSGYNQTFICIDNGERREPEYVEVQTPSGKIEVADIRTVQAAKEYLKKTFGEKITNKMIANKKVVLETAAANNIVFVNLPPDPPVIAE